MKFLLILTGIFGISILNAHWGMGCCGGWFHGFGLFGGIFLRSGYELRQKKTSW